MTADLKLIDDALLREWPLPAPEAGDKEARGRVLIVAGCPEIPGAAVLAATAALRAGAGKVTIVTPASIAAHAAFAVPESRVIPLEDRGALKQFVGKTGALLIGCGLAYGDTTETLTLELMRMFADVPTILDAAAMDLLCSARVSRFDTPVLLTPHAGEMAKLTGLDKQVIVENPGPIAANAAKDWNAVVALKQAITHIASPDGRLWRHDRGNIGLATSGSGDVLAGVVAGLLARGAELEQAAAWGVALHARAGERLAKRIGTLGYLARELPAEVPPLMQALSGASETD